MSTAGAARGAPVHRGRLAATIVFGVVGCAILLTLGLWQVQRLAWKTAIIARIEARLETAPVTLPQDPDPAAHQYLRIRADGAIEPGEIHIYTSVEGRGTGYRIVAPMRLDDGRRILLDRGFVPVTEKDGVRPTGRAAVEGALLWPQETDGFTPEPDRAKNIWIARDVEAMAAALETQPVLLVASVRDDLSAPLPLPVSVNIRNTHLQYALTWFGLAAVWAGMTVYALWRIKRRID